LVALLLLLRALKETKEKGKDCDALLQELQRRLEPLALGAMRRMVSNQMAEEQAILNTTLYSIFAAIERFRGATEAEAVSYCKRVVTTKTVDHIRREKGRLVYIGRETSLAPDQDSSEEPAEAESLEAMAQSQGLDPETLVAQKEVWQRVREALNCLKYLGKSNAVF